MQESCKAAVRKVSSTTGLDVQVWMRFGYISTVQYSNCGRGSQTSALASEPRAHEGAQRAQVSYPSLSGQV